MYRELYVALLHSNVQRRILLVIRFMADLQYYYGQGRRRRRARGGGCTSGFVPPPNFWAEQMF